MAICFQLSCEEAGWTHGTILEQSTDYDSLLKLFHEFLGECLMESVIGNNNVDYVCIETVECEFDDEGNIIVDDDNPVVAIEYTFNEPP
jgi:hypothetical protein